MEQFAAITDLISGYMYSYILIYLLAFAGIYFSIRLGFGQVTKLGHMFKLLGEVTKPQSKDGGGISPFKAFCISAASRIGTGNIVGVAVAIAAGGPGAVFWMWVLALLGGATAFAESTMAQIYKVRNEDGSFRGGPAYYITAILKSPALAAFFAVIVCITFGFCFNAMQANTLSSAMSTSLHLPVWVNGLIIAGCAGIVIFGGVHRVADVSSKIVPLMALLYIFVALFVIVKNISFVPEMFQMIFANAFGLKEFGGAAIGTTIVQGVKRGLFSNEAGMGSVPNAAATADTSHPAKQGFVQALGVYVDTWFVCTATAFIVLLGGESFYGSDMKGLEITQHALANEVGSWGIPFLSICILLFAFSSIVGNYYYGESNIQYIGGGKGALTMYRALCCLIIFLGSVADFSVVWNTGDIFMGIMAVINLYVIIRVGGIAVETYHDYVDQVKQGKNPVFDPKRIKSLIGGETLVWNDPEINEGLK